MYMITETIHGNNRLIILKHDYTSSNRKHFHCKMNGILCTTKTKK